MELNMLIGKLLLYTINPLTCYSNTEYYTYNYDNMCVSH